MHVWQPCIVGETRRTPRTGEPAPEGCSCCLRSVPRDGLNPVAAFDEAGQIDAMGLGWVVMAPRANRPLVLQKAGGLQGVFVYAAFAPSRGIGVFVSMNEFSVDGFEAMAKATIELISELAPR